MHELGKKVNGCVLKAGKLSRKCVGSELLMTEEHVHMFHLAPKQPANTYED